MLKRTTLTACSPLLQCGPEGVRGQLCPQEPDLSEHQTWPRSVDDDQRNTFLHGPSVHYGCQVQVLDVQNVLNEKKNSHVMQFNIFQMEVGSFNRSLLTAFLWACSLL